MAGFNPAELSNANQAARALLEPDDAALVDVYAAESSMHAYHVVAAFVLAGLEPPFEAAYTGTQMKIIMAHYAKYAPNGIDDDGLAGVPDLVKGG